MSEHEGFCAPVVESFYLDIPVIAFNAGAVSETMKGGGILVNKKNPIQIATLMDKILKDPDLKKEVIHSQREVLQKYTKNKTGPILLKYIKDLADNV